MAEKHPYVNGTGVLIQVLDHLKKSFPTTLNAEALKKLGFAPKNESYVLNTFRFLNLIDDKDTRTEKAHRSFTLHDSAAFQKEFSEIVKVAYSELFSLHGDNAWSLEPSKLITFFRQTDQSSEVVGTRQANTFRVLAAYAGHGELVSPSKPRSASNGEKPPVTRKMKVAGNENKVILPPEIPVVGSQGQPDRAIGLTVRVEINLPATGDQDTYDKIFKSIRENLLNG